MQTENKILKLNGGVGSWSTDKGVLVNTPSLAIGLAARFNLDLRTHELDFESILKSVSSDELQPVKSWYIAIDGDFNQKTAPVLLETEPDVTVSGTTEGRTILSFVVPNTSTQAFIDAAKSNPSVSLTVEIGGYDGHGQLIFLLQFPLIMRNRIWVEGGTPPDVASDPEYLTSAQVKALIAEATRSETPGPAGTTPHIGENGNWFIGTADTGIRAAGKDGKDGTDAEDGEDGKNAYELAVDNGYTGTVTEWLADLKGEPGTGLHIDATGEPAELHAYDDEKAGFVFACSVVDSAAKSTTKYFYVKNSDAEGDWCIPPLIDTTYLKHEALNVLEPVSFTFQTGKEYLQINMSAYPNSFLAAVTIDTPEGELQLPQSTLGIKKVLRTSDGFIRIYFGSSIQPFDTGHLYFTQFLGLTGSIAPEPDPEPVFYYGYITDNTLTSVTQITAAHLEQLTSVTATELGKTSLGVVPAGSWPVVIVPEGFIAYKDDGLGGFAQFSTNNGAANTGANGIKLDGIGKVYGEFKLSSAELFIYVKTIN